MTIVHARTSAYLAGAAFGLAFAAPNTGYAGAVVGIAGGGGCSFPTVADAIAAASPNDVILVSPGIYYENLGNISKALTISSSNASCTNPASSGAIIDGSGLQIAKITAPVTFANITLQNGTDTNGGLLTVSNELTLDSATLLDGYAIESGGCIYAEGLSSRVDVRGNSLLSGCEADNKNGGAIFGSGTDIFVTDDSVLEYNVAGQEGGAIFTGNGFTRVDGHAQLRFNTAHGGGGICVWDSSVEVSGYAHIDDNDVVGGGGGIAAQHSDGLDVWIDIEDHASISRNTVSGPFGGGGAVGMWQNTLDGPLYMHLDVSGSATLEDNETSWGTGGAIHTVHADVKIRQQAKIHDNRAEKGAGVYALTGELRTNGGDFWRNIAQEGGGGLFGVNAELYVNNTNFRANLALNGDGGGINTIGGNSDLTVTNDGDDCLNLWAGTNNYCSAFIGNLAAGFGGAVHAEQGPVTIEHTAMVGNLGHDGFGYYGGANTSTQLTNVLVADNSGPDEAAAVYSNGWMNLVHVTVAGNLGVGVRYGSMVGGFVVDSIVWANHDGVYLNSGGMALNNILQSVVGISSGTIFANPQFVTNIRGDYRLAPSSPAVDAASSSMGLDLDRVLRPQGAANDIGAFEYY